MRRYPAGEESHGELARVAMLRAPRLVAPGATVHVVARCNNREFHFTTPEDFTVVLRKLQLMVASYELTLYAYTLMSNHVHLLLQAPAPGILARPMRWFMTETARAFHRARKRTGHFWERRYRACLVEDDTYGLAALRYVDRNPVRAGRVAAAPSYPWSGCAAYAHGAENPVVTLHPSYLALGPDPVARQCAYQGLLRPCPDPAADARDPRWTTARAIGSPTFVARYVRRRGRPSPSPRGSYVTTCMPDSTRCR